MADREAAAAACALVLAPPAVPKTRAPKVTLACTVNHDSKDGTTFQGYPCVLALAVFGILRHSAAPRTEHVNMSFQGPCTLTAHPYRPGRVKPKRGWASAQRWRGDAALPAAGAPTAHRRPAAPP
eukprot:4649100-Pyramimonas_sp.AAC.1